MSKQYKYTGTVDFGEGLVVENPKFIIKSITYAPDVNKISAAVGFIINEDKGYQYVRVYEQDVPQGVEVFNQAIFDQMVLAFMEGIENA